MRRRHLQSIWIVSSLLGAPVPAFRVDVLKHLLLLSLLVMTNCSLDADEPAKPAEVIDQFLILVHPCPYEAMGTAETDPYRGLERAACERWLDAIPSLPKSTFAVQFDWAKAGPSPEKLQQALIGRLGTLTDPTALYVDLSVGDWLYRDPCAFLLTGVASLVEFHYATALGSVPGRILTRRRAGCVCRLSSASR